MKLRTTILQIAIVFSASCNNSSTDDSNKRENPTDVSGPGACLTGEKRKADGSCYDKCSLDSTGKEWCLRINQFPSDVDPATTAPRCSTGMLDHDECVGISVVVEDDGLSVLSGSTKRLWTNGNEDIQLDRLDIGSFVGSGYKVVYSYPTQFPLNPQLDSFHDSMITVDRGKDRASILFSQSNALSMNGDFGASDVEYFGLSFRTGRSSIAEFRQLCSDLNESDSVRERIGEDWIYLPAKSFETEYLCATTESLVPPLVRMKCDSSRENCFIYEVDLEWRLKQLE